MATQQGGTRGGWLASVPLWARIAVPVLLLVVVIAAVFAVASMSAQQDDPEEVAEAMCREAALEELDSLDRRAGDVAEDLEVTEADGGYRVQGSATYEDEDGETQYGQVRCVVREVDGALQVRTVRFGF